MRIIFLKWYFQVSMSFIQKLLVISSGNEIQELFILYENISDLCLSWFAQWGWFTCDVTECGMSWLVCLWCD